MTHLTSRYDLIEYAANHAPHSAVRRAIDRGRVIHHGLFKGGWVISVTYGGQTWVLGIRPVGVPPRLVCGLLKAVPSQDYVGGDGVLAGGDSHPGQQLHTSRKCEQKDTDDKGT